MASLVSLAACRSSVKATCAVALDERPAWRRVVGQIMMKATKLRMLTNLVLLFALALAIAI